MNSVMLKAIEIVQKISDDKMSTKMETLFKSLGNSVKRIVDESGDIVDEVKDLINVILQEKNVTMSMVTDVIDVYNGVLDPDDIIAPDAGIIEEGSSASSRSLEYAAVVQEAVAQLKEHLEG